MKSPTLLALMTLLPCAARAQDLPSMSEFKQRLTEVSAPAVGAAVDVQAAPAARADPAAAACPILGLSGATIGRGLFSMDYDVKIGDQKVGSIGTEGSGYAFKDAAGRIIAKSAGDGKVTDCSGAVIGSIAEEAGKDASAFTIAGPDGKTIGRTGAVSESSFKIAGPTGTEVASVASDHWLLDRVKLQIAQADPRLVAIVAVMNNAAAYRRAGERRRERQIDHGGRRV
jgi:hypothetical protein